MVGTRTMKWVVGVAVAVLLAVTPATCLDWQVEERAVAAEARAGEAERAARALAFERDSALAVARDAEQRAAVVRERIVYVRQAVPPAPPPVVGCEACETRARVLEALVAVQDTALAQQDTVIAALQGGLRRSMQEADTLRAGLSTARATLAHLATPKPVLRVPLLRRLLPSLTAGYGATLDMTGLHHGPTVALGWRIRL